MYFCTAARVCQFFKNSVEVSLFLIEVGDLILSKFFWATIIFRDSNPWAIKI